MFHVNMTGNILLLLIYFLISLIKNVTKKFLYIRLIRYYNAYIYIYIYIIIPQSYLP